ncbi:hypothetical protein ABEB36_013830 [Hypothenemus hampei]|uniref:Uncharacterized protein n=1 Tax=Hypothenemus hampei TaxID=57062 RepID=A0ABD1E5F3_HYPHA
MNNEIETNDKSFSVDTIHVTAPSILNKPSQTMPQRSPFAIQELLGLGDSQHHHHHHRSPTAAVSAITPNVYPHHKFKNSFSSSGPGSCLSAAGRCNWEGIGSEWVRLSRNWE